MCGPSVIRTPEWLPNRLANYYMYFAHHGGTYIRLAYSDSLEGPWQLHDGGSLRLEQAAAFHDHIASPDVHVDEANRRIRMYFHGPHLSLGGQWTGVAHSHNGIDFKASSEILGKFYFRVWQWRGKYYSLAKNNNEGWGELYQSDSGVSDFRLRGNFLKDMRHCAVWVNGHELVIFFSRVGDAPERILAVTVDLRPDWMDWSPSEVFEVLRPEEVYEGIDFPIRTSKHGSATQVHELRDPCFLFDEGKGYLFYSFAGEVGIAGAEISGLD